jgi:hypothetical protein
MASPTVPVELIQTLTTWLEHLHEHQFRAVHVETTSLDKSDTSMSSFWPQHWFCSSSISKVIFDGFLVLDILPRRERFLFKRGNFFETLQFLAGNPLQSLLYQNKLPLRGF